MVKCNWFRPRCTRTPILGCQFSISPTICSCIIVRNQTVIFLYSQQQKIRLSTTRFLTLALFCSNIKHNERDLKLWCFSNVIFEFFEIFNGNTLPYTQKKTISARLTSNALDTLMHLKYKTPDGGCKDFSH